MAERESIGLWSTTAATNSSVDPSINFAENQLPGTLNNSNRAEMAAHARLKKDNDGSLTTTGSANAYLLTVNATWTAYANGQTLSFKANFANTSTATLNVTNADGSALGAKAIRALGDVALGANAIISGGRYIVQYDTAANSAAGAWIIVSSGTSLNGQTGAVKIPSICGLRLTLVTGTPVMNSDQSSISTVYATPAYWAGNYVPLWDGSDLVPTSFGEVSQTTTDTTKSPAACVANAIYDIYAWNDGGTKRISRSDYWKRASTVTMTIASPCVVTWSGNTFDDGTPIVFTNSGGALPTGITSGTTYFVKQTAAGVISNTFNVAATVGGAAINTTGSQSGTHTGTAGDDTGSVARGSGGNCEVDYSTSGIALNKNAITNGPGALRGTLLGSIRTDASGTITYKLGGAASGGDAALLSVANVYNVVEVEAKVSDTTSSWTYTSATVTTFNPAVGSGLGNRTSVLSCLTRNTVEVALLGRIFVSAVSGAVFATIGVGRNSLTAYDVQAQVLTISASTSSTVVPRDVYRNLLGWNWFQALQSSDGTNSATYVGTAVQQRMIVRAWM